MKRTDISFDQKRKFSKAAFLCFASITYYFVLFMQGHAQLSSELKGLILFFDLCVVIPLLYHFTLAQKGLSPKFYAVVLFNIGMLTTIIKVPNNTPIEQLTHYYLYALSVVLAGAIIYFCIRLVQCAAKYSGINGEEKLTFMANDIGKNTWFSKVLLAELLTFYYAFCTWSALPKPNTSNLFSYHQKSGHYAMIIGITVFHIPGVAFLHVLLANVWPEVLLIFTALHIYTFYLCFAFAKSIKRRLIRLDSHTLHFQCGLLFSNNINISDIKEAKVVGYALGEEKVSTRLNASLLGFSNVLVTLRRPITLQIFSGISQTYNEVLIGVDEPNAFTQAINAASNNAHSEHTNIS
jgi:hypothetical protein